MEGAALTQARYFTALLGFPPPGGWPVAWSGDQCWIFSMPDNDAVDVCILVHWASNVELHLCTLAAGIQLCGRLWSSLHHVGDVPSDAEVESSYDRGAYSLYNKFFEYTARDDGDPDD